MVLFHESEGFTTPDEKDAALDGAANSSAVPGRVRLIDDCREHVHEHVNEHDHVRAPEA